MKLKSPKCRNKTEGRCELEITGHEKVAKGSHFARSETKNSRKLCMGEAVFKFHNRYQRDQICMDGNIIRLNIFAAKEELLLVSC